ncbi:unnamed protein product [Leptosia nina]|uniref:glycogenin glucosyltransferase n=1 Tax=Leptosia nina TaxID=320188 RepID=A0AAV1J939_9NEOP
MTNRAWVTLATNDSYGLGALVLAHSLRRLGSAYPAVVLITPSVTDAMRERLQAVFAEVITVDVLDSQDAAHLALLQRPELGITFTKIHCWNLTQYEKCVFLDADILVVQNCDELFEREELSAAPDVGWPDCFNSGVFVFKPSADTFSRLIRFAQERGSFDGGDQGLLNSFFSDWSTDSNKRLPFLYNVTSAAFYSYLPALKHFGQNLKIIHFIGPAKPWLQHYNFESQNVDAPEHLKGFLQLWWDLFRTCVHTQLDVSMGNIEEPSSEITRERIEDLPQFDEPELDYTTYEPALDPTSEFPWHHPDNQVETQDYEAYELDKNTFHDPWDMYRGNILPKSENSKEYVQPETADCSETRRYAWENTHYEPIIKKHVDYNPYNTFDNSDNSFYNHNDNITHQINVDNEINNKLFENNSMYNLPNHNASQTEYTQSYKEPHNDLPQHNYVEHNFHNTKNNIEAATPLQNKNNYIYCVHMDHEKPIYNNKNNEHKVHENGSEFVESYEDIRPRHPYDGFYLRHKATIDSRGIKLCSHEIPPIILHTSHSPPTDGLDDYEDAEDPMENGYYYDEGEETGVAGNLARVQPGVSLQREALDELSRRQGWESGNIDYMGADSFANIWAKISQTLNQGTSSPPKEPSPPKESPQAPVEKATEVQEVVEKLASASLDESNDIPVPAKEAAFAAGKPIDPVSQQDEKTEVPEPRPETVPEIESKSIITEVKTETPAATEVTSGIAVEQPVQSSPSEVENVSVSIPQTETPIDVPKADSESIIPTVSHETTVGESIPSQDIDHDKSISLKESENVHVPDPTKQTSIEPSVPESIQASPNTEVETVPTLDAVHEPKEMSSVSKSESAELATDAANECIETLHESKPVPEASVASTELASTPLPQEIETEKESLKSETCEVLDAKVAAESDKPQAPVSIVVPTPDPVPQIPEPTKPESDSVPQPILRLKKKCLVFRQPNLSRRQPKRRGFDKVEERRRPASKLQLKPPAAADPLPTPDSEFEDAATLAQSIIASELRTPTVTSASPTGLISPQLQSQEGLSVTKPDVPTPPVDPVSLSQIGVKPKSKPTTAAQIESSLAEKTEPEAPKKKVLKKVKKDGASSGEAPVPPPRKKEKKPKDK